MHDQLKSEQGLGEQGSPKQLKKVILDDVQDKPILSISIIHSNYSNCYIQHTYELLSSAYLSDDVLDAIASTNIYMSGQETGTVLRKPSQPGDYAFQYEYRENGIAHSWRKMYRYEIRSTCDSGD